MKRRLKVEDDDAREIAKREGVSTEDIRRLVDRLTADLDDELNP